MSRRVVKFRVKDGKLFFFFNGVFEGGHEQRKHKLAEKKRHSRHSFGNNCICKIVKEEITQFYIKSVFVLTGDFVFRKTLFILFKWVIL